MKPLSISEIDILAKEFEFLVGSKLQECWVEDSGLGLGLWNEHKGLIWMWIDLDPRAPFMVILDQTPLKKKKIKPIGLFIRKYAQGLGITKTHRLKEFGRVLEIIFEDQCCIEIRLIPHGSNVIVRANNKQISFHKIQDLPHLEEGFEKSKFVNPRSYEEIKKEWLKRSILQKKSIEDNFSKRIEKKKEAIFKVKEDLIQKQQKPWREIAKWLQEHRILEVPQEWHTYIKSEESLIWNIENCYSNAKKFEAKAIRNQERLFQLEKELEELIKKGDQKEVPPSQASNSFQRKKLFQSGLKARKLTLENNNEAFIGKSAKDNLLLLRKSKPWDLWIHIKDIPSAFGIIHKSRETTISSSEKLKVAEWLIHESLKKGRDVGTFEIIVTECRFVTPIKGDRLGRVTYKNENIFKVKL